MRPHTRDEVERFLQTPLSGHLARIKATESKQWVPEFLELQDYARRTPAFNSFLSERKLSRDDILIHPAEPTSKANYINRYPLADRCLDGDLTRADFMAVSSGTTGKAAVWPRSQSDEVRSCFALEQIFVESFDISNQRTLALVCFPLGIWIGGMYTASISRMLAAKGYSVVALTPGTNLGEIQRCLVDVSPMFDQTILCGYPPFLRDVIDELVPDMVDPSLMTIKLLMAGEPISESWREDIAVRLNMKNACRDCISMYGTADVGIVGFETEATIKARKLFSTSPDRRLAVFGHQGIPSLFEYQPYRLLIEPKADQVLLSALCTHPLFRYSIGDLGTSLTYRELALPVEIPSPPNPLPLVVLHGRIDHAVSFFGGNVYPEHISTFLDHMDRRKEVTGRFTMLVQHSAVGNRPLEIVVELQPGIQDSVGLSNRLAESLALHLMAVNSEYANYVPAKYQRPEITLKPHRDQQYFPRGKKQEYVRRE